MNRYGKYFVNHILWLDDGYSNYYLQDNTQKCDEILDVETVIFNWPEEAAQWLMQCMAYDGPQTLRKIRDFLTEYCIAGLNLYEMSDEQIAREAARQMCQHGFQLVIEPKISWAVKVDEVTAQPVLPITVEPATELDGLLADLRADLDAVVAEAKKQSDWYNAQMAGMNALEKALFVDKMIEEAVYEGTVGNRVEDVKATSNMIWGAVKAFPGFYVGYLKTVWKIAQTPSKMILLTAEALITGNANPLKNEIDKIVTPVAHTHEQAQKYRSMLTILLTDPVTYSLLYDFAERYWKALHPIEIAKMGVSTVADLLVEVLIAFLTAGAGLAVSAAAKSSRLVKILKKIEKITSLMRKSGTKTDLPDLVEGASGALQKGNKPGRVNSGGMPKVENPKPTDKLDKKTEKEYGDGKNDGPKTTDSPKITGDKGKTVNVDGHKIYDPSHPPLSSNPKAQYRFSDPTYRSTGGDVYFGENVATSYFEVRKNINGKSLYVGEARVDNVLDLTDPDVLQKMNIDPAKLTAKVDDVIAQKKVYGYTNKIANQAYDAGYSGIVYPSSRKAGSNAVALFDGRYDPKSIKQILDISIP